MRIRNFLTALSEVIVKILLMLLLSIIATTIPRNASAEPDQGEYSKQYMLMCNHYIDSLSQMKDGSTEILEYLVKSDPLSKQQTKLLEQNKFNTPKYNRVTAELDRVNAIVIKYTEGFDAFKWAHIDITKTKTLKAFKSQVDAAIAIFKEYKTCHDSTTQPAKVCADLKPDTCQMLSFDEKGLYTEETKDLVKFTKRYIDVSQLDYTSDKFNSILCAFHGISKGPFKQVDIFLNGFLPDSATRFRLATDKDRFDRFCINNSWISERNKDIHKVGEIFPNMNVSMYLYDEQNIKEVCSSVIAARCHSTYTVKDQIILSYPTVSCTVRDITKDDVTEDLKYFESNADKLIHSTLLDQIEYCQTAADNGYKWFYVKPAIDKDCKKKEKTKKKKR